MPRAPESAACPCGSDRPFAACCGPLLEGQQRASSAEQLMRSRYSAFALGYFDYLLATHHPDQRGDLDLAALEAQDRHTRWLALEVLNSQAGRSDDSQGQVAFVARFIDAEGAGELAECSRFERHQGHWVYSGGQAQFRHLGKPGRNAPCPCGSGKKYKRCHQR